MTDSINDKAYQISLDVIMASVPAERRKVALEAVRIAQKASKGSHILAARDIALASSTYAAVSPIRLAACDKDLYLQADIWYAGYIAGIRHERQRRRSRKGERRLP